MGIYLILLDSCSNISLHIFGKKNIFKLQKLKEGNIRISQVARYIYVPPINYRLSKVGVTSDSDKNKRFIKKTRLIATNRGITWRMREHTYQPKNC